MELTVEVIQQRQRIMRLCGQANNIISEIEELTGFDFASTHRGLAQLDELAPRMTQAMHQVETAEAPF